MQPYSIKDRFKEISSFMGLALLAVAFYIGTKVTPGTPDAFAPLVLNMLGSFGIAMPEPAKAAALGLDVDALAAAMAKAVAASAKPVAGIVFALLIGVSISACDPGKVGNIAAEVAQVCASSAPLLKEAEAAPAVANAAPTDTAPVLLAYAKASCNADGTVAATLAPNATPETPVWLKDVMIGLQAAAQVAPYVLPLL